MNDQYAPRYRFFFRSRISNILYPRLLLRMVTYLIAVSLGILVDFFLWRPHLWALVSEPGNVRNLWATLIATGLYGEVLIRTMLVMEETWVMMRESIGKRFGFSRGLMFSLPVIVIIVVGILAFIAQTRQPAHLVSTITWFYVFFRSSTMLFLIWILFLFIRSAKNHIPVNSHGSRDPSSWLLPKLCYYVPKGVMSIDDVGILSVSRQKEILVRPNAANSIETFQLTDAIRYLEASPRRAPKVLRSLPSRVVFEITNPYQADVVINGCGQTIYHDELRLIAYKMTPENRPGCRFSCGRRIDFIEVGSTYSEMSVLVKAIADIVKRGYGIRQCSMAGWGSYPMFMSLPHRAWTLLEDEYGQEKMDTYFTPVDALYKELDFYDSWLHKIGAFLRMPTNQDCG